MRAHFAIDRKRSNLAEGFVYGEFIIEASAFPGKETLAMVFQECVAEALAEAIRDPNRLEFHAEEPCTFDGEDMMPVEEGGGNG